MRACYCLRPARCETPVARFPVRDAIIASLATALLMAVTVPSIAADNAPAVQLMIHVDAPVLHTGGTVLVVANPVTKQAWDQLSTQRPSQAGQTAIDLKPGDEQFDVTISSKVSIIEFVYPERGSFHFKLRASGDAAAAAEALRTKRILAGGGYYTDKATGQKIEWKDVSVIHIIGPEADEGFSRLVRASSSEIMNAGPAKTQQPGITVYAPSAAQLEKALIKEPQ